MFDLDDARTFYTFVMFRDGLSRREATALASILADCGDSDVVTVTQHAAVFRTLDVPSIAPPAVVYLRQLCTDEDDIIDVCACPDDLLDTALAVEEAAVERLHAQGFDLGARGCSQCHALAINGTPTHESGCPMQTHRCKGCDSHISIRATYCATCAR